MTPQQGAILHKVLSPEFHISPLKFALWAYPWGTGDLKQFKGPRRWQSEVMLEMEDYLQQALQQQAITATLPDFFREAIASGRGPGKSALLGMIAHWFISTRIGGSTWIAANGEPQLRTKTFPEIAKWIGRGINSEFFDITSTSVIPTKWFKEFIESPEGLNKNTRYYYIQGQLWSQENPDAFAGAHNFDGEMCLFDEASGIADEIWTVQEGVFTENIADRFWFAFSNPRKNTGAFYECFHKDKARWRTRQIDSRTVEDISSAPFEGIVAKYGEDSDEARVEVYGQFPLVGEDQYIPPALVDEAMERPHKPSGKVVLGVDVARFGNDSSVIAIRQGSSLVGVLRYTGLDTMAVVGKVIEAIKRFKPDLTIVDEGGMGAGVLDRLVEQGYKVRGVSFGSRSENPVAYANKRAEMWGTMREWLRTASIGSDTANAVKENKALKEQMTAPRYKTNSSGAIVLESKQDMKKRGVASPDEADAIAISLAYPVGDGVLMTDKIRLWSCDKPLPQMIHIVQSYAGAFTEKTLGQYSAGTTWGVFEQDKKRCLILLDCWTQKFDYTQMREKVIKDWHSTYGGDDKTVMLKPRKADVALVGVRESGEALVNDMRFANVQVPNYVAGEVEGIERAHQAASVIDTGVVYVPESKRLAKQPMTWVVELLDQCDRFPNDERGEMVGTMSRALMYLRDNKWLETPQAAVDEYIEEDREYTRQKARGYVNPYAL